LFAESGKRCALCCAWLVGCQVAFSTHEAKLPPEDDSSDEDEDQAGEDQADDTPIPMESVMGPFKVSCKQSLQHMQLTWC